MPRGDRTGPAGQGPMTGRRMGYCAGFNMPGFMNSEFVRGFGKGFGRRFGFGRFFQPIVQTQTITEEEEKEILQEELKALKRETDEIQKRLKELK